MQMQGPEAREWVPALRPAGSGCDAAAQQQRRVRLLLLLLPLAAWLQHTLAEKQLAAAAATAGPDCRHEFEELVAIYMGRGLQEATARQVVAELTEVRRWVSIALGIAL
jgi:hypothetical protein